MYFFNKPSQSGETLLGILIATAILLIIITAATQYFVQSTVFFKSVDKMQVLQEVMQQNLIEIQTQDMDQFPQPTSGASCLLKQYDIKGTRTSGVKAKPTPCNTEVTQPNQLYVIIKVEPQSAIDFSFDKPNMKLPDVSEKLFKFTVMGQIYNSQINSIKTLNLVYYKALQP